MIDSVVIGEYDSYYDFDASMKEREIGEPKKKSIKETVPFSNEVYDFTKINGEIYWEERVLTYVFEILADSPIELEEKKRNFKKWIMNVHKQRLYDPYIEDYYFTATFDDISCDDSEIEKSTITVTFTANPYMTSEFYKAYEIVATEESQAVEIYCNSCHGIVPDIVNLEGDIVLGIDSNPESDYGYIGSSYNLSAGITRNTSIKLTPGLNKFHINSVSGEVPVRIVFHEEVL